MRRRHIFICKGILGKSKYDAQVKPTMKSSAPVGTSNQLVDSISTITLHWNNLELCADTLHASDYPLLTCMSTCMHSDAVNAVDIMKSITLEW